MLKKTRKKLKRFSNLLNFVLLVLITVLVIQVMNLGKDYFSSWDGEKQERILVEDKQGEVIGEEKEEKKKQRLIDGVLVLDSEDDFYPKMVTIENNEAARPQSGIDKANLVIEAPVEGGITRFLAIFADNAEVENIGPIRSARPYFLDWAREFDALYVHVGGSPESLKIIKQSRNLYNLNQYFESRYFWRSSRRLRPHNVYSSSELLDKAVTKKKLKEADFGVWKYKEDSPVENEAVEEIFIDFSTHVNRVGWKYNKENNDYIRYQAGEPHTTIDGKEIRVKNIAVQKTSVLSIDSEDRKKIKTIGEGDALIFLDGKVIKGIWKKPSIKERTRFYNEDDEEIEFNRGITWIEVVGGAVALDY